jgi:hypothetical protein
MHIGWYIAACPFVVALLLGFGVCLEDCATVPVVQDEPELSKEQAWERLHASIFSAVFEEKR